MLGATERGGAAVEVLITPDEVACGLASSRPPVVLDVRWRLGDADGREHYRSGHIPRAVYVDLDTELAGPASPTTGRHPLPALGDMQAAARRWGIRSGDQVVVYDDWGGLAAARAWWLLRWGGIGDVRLLDGGLGGWRASGRSLESGEASADPGDVVLAGGAMPVLDADETAQLARTGVVLDARAAERYRGDVEPVDPRAGHIPGALSASTRDNVVDGRFLAAAALAERFAGLGVRPGAQVGVYCGSGVTAAHEVAALAIAGVPAALYPGSWSQWSSDPTRPVATGPEPG